MKYEIRQELIPDLPQAPYRNGVGCYEGIVAHSTGNTNDTDEANLSYFRREWRNRQAFPHFFVDHDSITQIASVNYRAWAAGKKANDRYIHVELCQTTDKDKFWSSYRRYVWLIAYLLKQRNLGVVPASPNGNGTLWSHKQVSQWLGGTDHVDPVGYLEGWGITWGRFVADVQIEYDRLEGCTMTEADANKIIRLLGGIWQMGFSGETKEEIHRLANELRKASGQPVQD